MYLEFYGLREKPFNPTPDPRFLYLSASHREALAQLTYGIRERRGFLVLTGEVGTGKTTLLRTLLSELDPSTETAVVVNSMLGFEEILEYVLEDYGIESPKGTRAGGLIALNRFLTERHRQNLDTLLVIDEAQNLDLETLEQIRLLSNFETTTDKLLQILLVGQPELRNRLARPEIRQLRQRISIRAGVEPLSPEESGAYVMHRLRVARGADAASPSPFTAGALGRVAAYAGGVPRLLNLVCDHSLLMGYAEQRREIDTPLVDEAITYVQSLESTPAPAADPGPRKPAVNRFVRWLERWYPRIA